MQVTVKPLRSLKDLTPLEPSFKMQLSTYSIGFLLKTGVKKHIPLLNDPQAMHIYNR
jgi:hypothetical protein